jgi:hypothetical protein
MELATATVKKRGNSYDVTYGDDAGLLVQFYMEAVRQGAESREKGREIYKDVPFIQIQFPGDRNRLVQRPADLTGKRGGIPDPERFPRQWQAFQNQQEVVHEGTPIEEWGPISRSLALSYKSLNIHTVEQLATVSDSVIQNLGHGGRQMRDKAISWLKATEGDAELLKLQEENETLRNDVAMLKEQMKELSAKAEAKRKK